MKLYLATGEELSLDELVGSEVLVEWQDPRMTWEGRAGDLPESEQWRTRGLFLGVSEGSTGPEVGIAAEDREDGAWRAATAIPASLITKVVRFVTADEYFPTRTV